MVSLQILSKIISSKDMSIIDNNALTEDYFVGYEEEYNFIINHKKEFGNIPDSATFLSKFPDFEIVEVQESDKYLVDTIQEEYLYYKSIPIVQHIADLLKTDANQAASYMLQATKLLRPNYGVQGTDIIADSKQRLDEFVDKQNNHANWFFTTGFEELDEIIGGLQRGEELAVILARTSNGKSWISEKIITHIWEIGFDVGYLSPEMSASSVGYRFDTLYQHISNKSLVRGQKDIEVNEYQSYIEKLQDRKNKFIVSTPYDFGNSVTVSKLREWVKQYELDVICVDGITYMSDERYKRGDTKTTSLTHISEDLMAMSVELKIPIIIVVQSNRGGVKEDTESTPELEDIRDSDGISHNASIVLSLRQMKNSVLRMVVKKQRFGLKGGRLDYTWDIDKGDFVFIPSVDDAQPKERTERKVRDIKKQYNDKEDVF